jgi:polysaccharide export outer membrane protein
MLRVQVLGDILAGGLTAQQLEARVVQLLGEKVMANAQVDVVVEQASGLRYTIYGFVAQSGMFNLQNADLRLIDALSLTGRVPKSIEHIYVIRQVALTEEIKTIFERSHRAAPASTKPDQAPVDIEELIKQLGPASDAPRPGMFQQEPPADIIDIDALEASQDQPAADEHPEVHEPTTQDQVPSALPPVDVDELESVRTPAQQPVDVDQFKKTDSIMPEQGADDSFIFVPERGEWVRVRRQPGAPGSDVRAPSESGMSPEEIEAMTMVVERIIEVDYQRLLQGDSSQNLVIRPGDRIYVAGPPQGYVYVDGEIIRAGVYQLPNQGMLTLSRFVAAAGGLTPIAIPNRCDLTRKIGRLREATIRVDLAAIRQRTEPDIALKPDDHLIIGTSFIATPLAVFRNGLRMTYGFGLVVDRNFGNDVFGPPPGTFD